MGDARRAALEVLEKCRRGGAWSDAALGSVMDAHQIDGRDRGLASVIAYGVMQNRMLLDHVIAQRSNMEQKKIEPKVLDLLRIGAYQILMLDRIPASAAVNSTVKLCKALGYARAAGFVNAVLRKLASDPPAFPTGQDAHSLSLRWSHPLWLTELYIRLLGVEDAVRLLERDNAPVPITLQCNTLRTDAAALMESLRADGLSCRAHPWLPDCVILDGGDVRRTAAYRNGGFYVQDAAAKLAVMAAAPRKGQSILDACAAPGGKTFAAAVLSVGAQIAACDIHENKLRRITAGADRLGLPGISCRAQDARSFVSEWEGAFDVVLADVPCSGLGVIRKKPDIRYKDPAAFSGLPAIQGEILQNVSRYVKTGGTLLYSTCTVRPEENEDVVRAFLAAHPAYTYEDFTLPGDLVSASGMLQLWPQRNGTDGFFMAKMRRWK